MVNTTDNYAKSVFDTYRMLRKKGLSREDAEQEIKSKLHILQFPESIRERLNER